MRIAIIIGANPAAYQNLADTMLRPGKWKVIGQNLVDSKIIVLVDSARFTVGETFTLDKFSSVRADFDSRGTEKAVSILVEKVG